MDYIIIVLPKVPPAPRVDLTITDKVGLDTGELRAETPEETALELDYSTKKQVLVTAEAATHKDWPLTGRFETVLGTGVSVIDKDSAEYTAQWISAQRFENPADLKDFISSWCKSNENIDGLQVAMTDNPTAWLLKNGYTKEEVEK